MLASLTQPVIFAHRGSSAYAPENTLAAFKLAAEQGADAIELDAKLSADGEVVVIHDQTVNRTTNGTGRVSELRLEELQRLDAGAFFSDHFRGEKIPTLRQVFEAVGAQLYINVELTNYASPGDDLVARVAALVTDMHMQEKVLFSSFLPANLVRVKRLLPECPRAILAGGGLLGWLARSFIGRLYAPDIVHPNIEHISAAYCAREHSRGRRVHVWTVNDRTDLLNAYHWGVDGVITDDPPTALDLRGQL